MAVSFPSSPTNGDIHNEKGRRWIYDTTSGAWKSVINSTTIDTDTLLEGTNLFYTDERVDDRVSTMLIGGSNITTVYDDAANTLTVNGQPGYANSDVDTHLNQSTAATGEYLKWDGTDYDWASVPAGYANSDVDLHLNVSGATSNQVLAWNGTDYTWANNPVPTGDSNRVVYDLADPANTIVLDPGSAIATATYKGDVLKPDGTVIVDVSSTSATFSGGLMGNVYGDVYDPTGTDKILETGTGNNDASITATVTGTVSDISNHTTTDLTEGTNLYYTDVRADARITASDTDSLSEGSTNLYYTQARADARVSAALAADVVIGGNLTVNGTTTTLNTATLDVEDLNITVAFGAADAAAANGAGLTVAGANATITYDSTNDEWDLNKDINVTGGVRASQPFFTNSHTVTENHTVATGDSAMAAGPVTVNSGVTVTISSGSRWVIV